jgi:hypothetical protein
MPRTLTIANAINTWPKLAMFKPPSFAAVQNSLQLKPDDGRGIEL